MLVNQVIKVMFNQDPPTVQSVTLYVVQKSGQFLSKSQAAWLVASGQVKVDGIVNKRAHQVMDAGEYTLEVYGKSFRIMVEPISWE